MRDEFYERLEMQKYVVPTAVGIFVLLLVFLSLGSFYTVAAHEQAVVLRHGRYYNTTGPGLHFKIPIVDQAVLVETNERSMRLPLASGDDDIERLRNRPASQDEALILTGDLYAGVVEWNVLWRVVDPRKFVLSIDEQHVERLITAIARSTMYRAVGDYSADELLTGKREEIGLAALNEMQEVLDGYDSGAMVVALQMQRITPPERVKPAFDEVNASIQQREQLLNEANRERNRMMPQAEASRDRLIRQAEGYAARRRAEAEGEIAALLARYQAYREAPDITRRRLYLEAMEGIIIGSGPKTVIDSDLRGVPLLNLGSELPPPLSRRERDNHETN